MPKLLQLIVACTENRVISRAGRLPWSIPEDAAYYHAVTAGQTCILGRRTFVSWRQAREDGRHPIVVTRRPAGTWPGVQTVGSFGDALAAAERLPGDVVICGGERIYAEALALDRPLRLLLTLIHAELPGDRFFPEWRGFAWRETARRESSDTRYRYTFLTLERGPAAA